MNEKELSELRARARSARIVTRSPIGKRYGFRVELSPYMRSLMQIEKEKHASK